MTGLIIRPALESDIPDLAHIHVQGWKDSYGGIVDQAFLDSLKKEDRAEKWKEWLAQGENPVLMAFSPSGSPAGFVNFGKLRTPLPGQSPIRPLYTGEIYALYILKDFWRQGLGTTLMRAAAAELKAMKHQSLCLWVMEKNIGAVSFYKKLGGARCGKKDTQIGQTTAREIAFGWRSTASLLSHA